MPENKLYNFVKKHNITKATFVGYSIALTTIIYLTFFTIFNEKGLVKLFSLKKQIANKELTKQDLSVKMQAKKNMVDGMNLNSLDVDLLDEQARKSLGYVGKNEMVIYQDKNNKSE